jgi:chitin disaccharide deacetylase
VNEAVAIGHREGILTAASLMVGEPYCREAVSIARRLPSLRVGLHLVLTECTPVLPAGDVSELVDRRGRFRGDLIGAGFKIFVRPRARRQLASEIAAQFDAFQATGLALDHVNAHRHFHLHPTIAGLILKIAPRYGAPALRIPIEPKGIVTAIDGWRKPGYERVLAAPWARLLKSRARRAGLASPDSVFGLSWTGAMTERRLACLLARLPGGVTEIYTHPATAGGFAGAAPGYRYEEELAALVSPVTRAALSASGARTGGFADLTFSAAT